MVSRLGSGPHQGQFAAGELRADGPSPDGEHGNDPEAIVSVARATGADWLEAWNLLRLSCPDQPLSQVPSFVKWTAEELGGGFGHFGRNVDYSFRSDLSDLFEPLLNGPTFKGLAAKEPALLMAAFGSVENMPMLKSLDLGGCDAVGHLPRGLRIAGDLSMKDCPAWDGIIPEDAKIVGKIHADEVGSFTLAQWRDKFGFNSCFINESDLASYQGLGKEDLEKSVAALDNEVKLERSNAAEAQQEIYRLQEMLEDQRKIMRESSLAARKASALLPGVVELYEKAMATEPGVEVDPMALETTFLATGASEYETLFGLWDTGDPQCRIKAMSGLSDTLRECAKYENSFADYLMAALEKNAEFTNRVLASLTGLKVSGDLTLKDVPGLRCLPPRMSVGGGLMIQGCEALEGLPVGLRVLGGDLVVGNCPNLKTVGEGLCGSHRVWIQDCQSLEKLPNDLVAGGSLSLNGCPRIREVPIWSNLFLPRAGKNKENALRLNGCTGVEALPDLQGLPFEEINLSHSGIRSLPRGIKAEKLWLVGCKDWDGIIPEDAVIAKRIYTDRFGYVENAIGTRERYHSGITLESWRSRYGVGSCHVYEKRT